MLLSHCISQRPAIAAILLAVALGASTVAAQEALPPLQFNVPYRCNDGTTIIIHRCDSHPRGEV